MHRRTTVRIALACTGLIALAMAAASIAAGGPKTTGGVKYTTADGGDGHARFTAQPSGLGAKGNVNIDVEGVANEADFKGDVTCYFQSADNKTAAFSGPITMGEATVSGGPITGPPAEGFRITVFDGGEPGAGKDLIRVQRTAMVQPCTPVPPVRPVEQGNLQVHPG